MNKHLFRRGAGMACALLLSLSMLPGKALAVQSQEDFTLVELVATDVTLDETRFEYTGEAIRPNVTVRSGDTLLTLDKDYTLDYENNVNVGQASVIVEGIATASETLGYTGRVEVPFYILEKTPAAPEDTLVEIIGTDVTVNATEFVYTGSPISPEVTVCVGDKLLYAGQDYTLELQNNIEPGTATLIVTGREDAGYTGRVEINFTIRQAQTLVQILGTDVVMDGSRFPYTGEAIEPAVTVTVQGQVLTAGEDYTLEYQNNIEPGTASLTVTGVVEKGYSGEVTMEFTIEPKQEENEGETEAPAFSYEILKGDGKSWWLESGKNLTFTLNGSYEDFTGVSVNGKRLSKDDYTLKDGKNLTVTLKHSYLNELEVGKYTVAFHFEEGEAEGFFRVKDGLDTTNPATGDSFNLHLWTAVLFVSITGLVTTVYVYRKSIRK